MTIRAQPVGDCGVMLRFGDTIDPQIHDAVVAHHHAAETASLPGVTEFVPSFTALFVGYDPLTTDFDTLTASLLGLKPQTTADRAPQKWVVPVCYDAALAPDLKEVATRTGQSTEAVINAHLAGEYRVYMYGFAPGYAYMGGVPKTLQLPRKEAYVRDVPAGTVCIAGPQGLVTTMCLPNGWWRLGRTAFQYLRPDEEDVFPLSVGDQVQFKRISRDEYERTLEPEHHN